MTDFILRRALLACLTVLGVTLVASALLHVSGDPIAVMLQSGISDPKQTEMLRRELGLDKPFILQYLDFLTGFLQGDLGQSLRFRRSTLELILDRLPATLLLGVSAMAFALLVALPVGVISATHPNSVIAHVGRLIALVGQSVPLFWLGILLVLVFSVNLRMLPSSGMHSVESLVLPTITLGLYPMARIMRTLRSSLLEAISKEYMYTARSKGLSERRAVIGHALRNASLPVVTVIGLQFGALLGGAVVTETIFSWPGIGSLSIQAVQARDLPLVRAIVTVCAVLFIIVNLLTDLLCAWLNPRVRLS